MTLSILITLLCPIRIDYISFRGESQATAVYSPKIPAEGIMLSSTPTTRIDKRSGTAAITIREKEG
jgi:hypothetical protein